MSRLLVQYNSQKLLKNKKNFIISSTNHEKEIFEFLKKINKKFKVYKLYDLKWLILILKEKILFWQVLVKGLENLH